MNYSDFRKYRHGTGIGSLWVRIREMVLFVGLCWFEKGIVVGRVFWGMGGEFITGVFYG